jgi:hypothetical protein
LVNGSLSSNVTIQDDYTIYPAPCKQWMLCVLQKFVPEEKDARTEALVVNRRRSLDYDIQASDWDEGQKQLEKCLHRKAKRSQK